MKILLPNRFKKKGFIMAPIGLIGWLLIQLSDLPLSIRYLLIDAELPMMVRPIIFTIASISLISFLLGVLFICFSEEKYEDERIKKIRVESFQIAALSQLFFIFLMFLSIIILGSPNEGLLMLLFIISLLIFWIVFIFRFSYKIHVV
ncbi:hypothetical protein [Sphingobacterium bovisgrunnientis]|uniref:hypothetical protein n=1 Tax=Sphingobacterium bovisgrunnientis TaxID=1874697 RepID=UPI00135C36AD|nr:hypothetical protein [Sphingobacterium bovisgrunnientis]